MNPMPTLASTLVVLALVGLPASAAPVAPGDSGDSGDQAWLNVQAARPSIRELSERIAALSPADRAEASAALAFLTSNCPYTRAAMLLPHVVLDAIDELPAAGLGPAGRAELEALREGLELHVAVLDALDVHVTSPGPEDVLHGGPPGALPDLESLRAAEDPVADMARSSAQVTPLARRMDALTAARIDASSAAVEAATGVVRPCPRGPWAVSPGQPWTLGMELGAWREDLQNLAALSAAPATTARLDALVALLDAYGQASLASDATPAGGPRG